MSENKIKWVVSELLHSLLQRQAEASLMLNSGCPGVLMRWAGTQSVSESCHGFNTRHQVLLQDRGEPTCLQEFGV